MLPYPHVVRFRVVPGPVTRRTIPGELATDYRPPPPAALAGAPRRTIALVQRELDGEPSMLTMRELVIAGDERHRRMAGQAAATETTARRVAWEELPTIIATVAPGWASPMAVAAAIS